MFFLLLIDCFRFLNWSKFINIAQLFEVFGTFWKENLEGATFFQITCINQIK